ncbi:type II site-specific deoxyribonuclease [Pantoea ananatis]|uniref:type II site-specific deoxyribonuclease n=1 Tax=Pantoea ananas TaxID=553 RepID=UPI0013035179|nr:type II site-specific deoxyribonuclease [Pantoea ananatis]
MDDLKRKIDLASKLYNKNQSHITQCRDIAVHSLDMLNAKAIYSYFGDFEGKITLSYYAFQYNGDFSRPVRPDLFISESDEFLSLFEKLLIKLPCINASWSSEDSHIANKVIYTSVMSVSCAFDLWKKGSRKTPGTFFEILMAAILKIVLPDEAFSKHIPLVDTLNVEEENIASSSEELESSSVSTDIVIKNSRDTVGAVIPLKITTRERIVQPFAQQKILDSYFGRGKYNSFVACISETQQVKNKNKVNHICVPGTIRLYQKYLAKISGIYYCDIPERYLMQDLTSVLPVKSIGDLFKDIYLFFKEKN